MEISLIDVLKDHSLRITDCRLSVLDYMMKSEQSVASRDLELEFPHFDRVTLYRTLHSFVEKGIIHSIPNETGVARYALCFETCAPNHHNHSHAHFKCESCDTIVCLPAQEIPTIKLPGYLVKEVNLILEGICETCNA